MAVIDAVSGKRPAVAIGIFKVAHVAPLIPRKPRGIKQPYAK